MSECQMCHCEDATVLEFCEDCYTEMKSESDAAGENFNDYWQQNSHDDYCNSILAGEMDSGDVEMLQEQLRKFSPPHEYDDD